MKTLSNEVKVNYFLQYNVIFKNINLSMKGKG